MRWNYYNSRNLRLIGISEDMPDLRDLMVVGQATHKAYCKSRKCSGEYSSRGTEKKVKPETETCPDCGYFLFWKTTFVPSRESKETSDEQVDQSDSQHP